MIWVFWKLQLVKKSWKMYLVFFGCCLSKFWYFWPRNMNLHIQKMKFASTRNLGNLFLGPKIQFSFFMFLIYFTNFEIIRTYVNLLERGQKSDIHKILGCGRLPEKYEIREKWDIRKIGVPSNSGKHKIQARRNIRKIAGTEKNIRSRKNQTFDIKGECRKWNFTARSVQV